MVRDPHKTRIKGARPEGFDERATAQNPARVPWTPPQFWRRLETPYWENATEALKRQEGPERPEWSRTKSACFVRIVARLSVKGDCFRTVHYEITALDKLA